MKNPDQTIDTTLLRRYLEGEAGPEEEASVHGWGRDNPLALGLLTGLKDSSVYEKPVADFSRDEVWNAIEAGISNGPERPSHKAKGSQRGLWSRWATGIAALVVAAFVLVKSQIGLVTSGHISSRTYSTKSGERAAVTLSDGSRVTLAPETRLVVSQSKDGTRDVTLDGQALFVVQSSRLTPFVIHTNGATTRVLGTTFVVRGYSSDSSVRVVVSEGKVQLSPIANSRSSILLAAGDAARVTNDGTVIAIPDINISEALGWTEGKLVFSRAPLQQVLREMERTYNIRIDASGLKISPSTEVTLSIDGSPSNALNKLAMTIDVSVKRQGNLVILSHR